MMNARTIRSVVAAVPLRFQRMTDGFGAYGLRAGGPITLDPFLNLDDFQMSEPTFPPHPHAGFSAITYMFEDSEGAFINRDSLGDRSRIEPGAFHWTQAARGMMHEEVPERRGEMCHGLQMFVNLRGEHKLREPRAFHIAATDVPTARPSEGARIRILAGSFGDLHSPLHDLLTPVTFLDVHLDAGAVVEIEAPAEMTAFGLVVRGSGTVGPEGDATSVLAHTGVGFAGDGSHVRLCGGDTGLQILVGAGYPIREPVVFGGPFVMTTEKDLREAEQRFRSGHMGALKASF